MHHCILLQQNHDYKPVDLFSQGKRPLGSCLPAILSVSRDHHVMSFFLYS